jgi:hypothetical protein
MPSSFFNFDPLSTLLGFLAGVLITILVTQIIHNHKSKETVHSTQQRKEKPGKKHENSLEFRNLVLQKAQSEHLLNALCSLDDILVEPTLIGSPYPIPADISIEQLPFTVQLFPYSPDVPQLLARLPYPTISPYTIISRVKKLAIVAPAGSGKSVTLASLASRLAKEEISIGKDTQSIPLYFHASDIVFSDSAKEPVEILIQAIGNAYPSLSEKFLSLMVSSALQQNTAILLLDGLDELSLDNYAQVAIWLLGLCKVFPHLQVVVTLSPSNMTYLIEGGFNLMGLSAWKEENYHEWLSKWSVIWSRNRLQHQELIQNVKPINTEHIQRWMARPVFQTPLEWTLQVWGDYSNDLSGDSLPELLLSYLNRIMPGCFDLDKWAVLCYSKITTGNLSITSSELAATFPGAQKFKGKVQNLPDKNNPDGQSLLVIPQNSSEYIDQLIFNGFIRQNRKSEYRFSHPLILTFLASFQFNDITTSDPGIFPQWETQSIAIGLSAIRNQTQKWFEAVIKDTRSFIYLPGYISKILNLPSNSSDWKNRYFQTLSNLISNNNIPFGLRYRIIPAFWYADESVSLKFFQYLLNSPTEYIRKLALIGLIPYTNSAQVLQLVQSSMKDSSLTIRQIAILVLSTSHQQQALEYLMDLLIGGSEKDRFTAAEALTNCSTSGMNVLKEAMQVEDLMIRRSAVFGLSHVREDWSKDILEETAVQDSEWMVKNAATQAFEYQNNPQIFIPRRPIPPSEAAWLIEFASQQGRGIPSGSFPMELLIQASHSPNLHNALYALQYLMIKDDPDIVQLFKDFLKSDESLLRDYALYNLVTKFLRGKKI